MLNEFLNAVRAPVRQKDANRLQDVLRVEPPLPEAYDQVINELRKNYPKGNDAELSTLCDDVAPPHPEGGSSWSAFGELLRRYLIFLRDLDLNNYLDIFNSLTSLLNQCNTAMSEPTYGPVILPTVLYLTRVLAGFAVTLDKNPDVVARQRQGRNLQKDGAGEEKVTFVERSANVVRDAFIKCINDKSGISGLAGPGRRGKPENKRVGIYQTANFCLELLFRCRKLRNAEQMFVSIDNQSPPLSYYPASQRVTYLYYLGRYHFANNHFYRAQLALQEAYNTCLRSALQQRRKILIYLISSNICLGRFPSDDLLLRPEAQDLGQHFKPIRRLITQGDIVEFRNWLDVQSPSAGWFLQHRVLLQLRNRGEVLVWRSLIRKGFKLTGYLAEDGRGMPFLRLSHVQAAVQLLDRKHHGMPLQPTSGNMGFNTSPKSSRRAPIHDDFVGIAEAAAEAGFDLESGTYLPETASKAPQPSISSNLDHDDNSPDLGNISIAEIESIVSSLIQQSLLRGFITHVNPRFAIPGSKARGALATGFPPIWQTIEAKADGDVPGWVKEEKSSIPMAGGLGGRVINLSGARPVGAGP